MPAFLKIIKSSYSRNCILTIVVLSFLFFMITSSFGYPEDRKNVPSNVIASIDGRQITVEEIDELIKLLPEELQPRYLNKKMKRDFINDYLDTEILYIEGKKKGLEKDKEYILRASSIERALIRDIYLKKYVMEGFTVTEEEISDYYNKNKKDFKYDAFAYASHILVDTVDDAEMIVKLISDGKITFEEAVIKYSTDKKTSGKEGKLGLIYEDKAIPGYKGTEDVVNRIFAMKENEIAGPVKSGEGYHIVKLIKMNESKYLSLAEVRGKIDVILDKQKMVKLIQDEINKLRNKHDVKIYKENF